MPDPSEPDRIRVAFVITELDVGGAELALTHLVLGLDRGRFEPFVFSLWERPAEGSDWLVQQLEAAKVPVRFLDGRATWRSWASRHALAVALRDLKIDIVQNFLFRANVIGTSAARAAGVEHVLLGVRVADPPRWRMWLECQAARYAARVVCVSDSVAAFVQRRWPCEPGKIAVIPNGIDLSRYPAAEPANLAELGIGPGRRVLITVGRLHRQKGHDWLLDLAPQLFRHLPEHDLLIVGDGPEAGSLQVQAKTLGVSDRVHFAGWRADVPQLLAASDLLLLPSRWEGMPNVLLEAMASKLPVVATRVEGVEQLLGELSDQQTVEFGASEDFIRLVQNLVGASDVGEQNRRRIAAEFSLQQMIGRYQQLYEDVCGC